jgi:uncharacterized protein with beta-barrel porin domain
MNSKTLQQGLLLTTSILVSVVGYGRRAYAADPLNCVLTPSTTTYLCSGTATAQIAIDKDNADVVTEAGFSIDAKGDTAISITGDGELSFTDAHQSSIGGQIGLDLYSGGDVGEKIGITVVSDSDISAAGTGIQAYITSSPYVGLLSIDVGGTVAATNFYGISTRNLSVGTTEITVDSGATVSGAGGITAMSNTTDGGGDISITVDGEVSSNAHQGTNAVKMMANALGSTSLTVGAGGSVYSKHTTAAVVAALGVGGDVTVDVAEGGSISSEAYGKTAFGLYAYSGKGNADITIGGEVSASGDYSSGVGITAKGAAILTIGATGYISSGNTGARVDGDASVTVTLAEGAKISSYSVGLVTSSRSGDTSITVDGEIKLSSSDGYAIYATSNTGGIGITVGAKGEISAGYSAILAKSSTADDVNIAVYGDVSSSLGAAVYVSASSSNSTVVVGKSGAVGSSHNGGIQIVADTGGVLVAGTVTAASGYNAITISNLSRGGVQLIAGYSITGDVVIDAPRADLLLSGTATGADGGSFDVSKIDDGSGDKEQFQGFDWFGNAGTADWTLSGALTADIADWHADGGRLFVDATMGDTTFAVAKDATIGGTGTIGGLTLVSGSHVAPGDAGKPGTLTVNSDVTFVAKSEFDVLLGSGMGSKLVVNGKATIDNDTALVVSRADDEADYTDGESYTILSTEDGLIGGFSGVSEDFAFLDMSLTYGDKDLVLTLKRNQVDFDTLADTANQKAVAVAIQGLAGGNPIYNAITVLSEDEAKTAFETLSGNTLASVPNMVIAEAGSFDALLDARTAAVSKDSGVVSGYAEPPAAPNAAAAATADLLAPSLNNGFWLRATGTRGTLDGDSNGSGADYTTGGLAAGVDTWLTPNLLAGLAIDHVQMGENFAANGGTAEVASTALALYSRFAADAFTLDGRIGVGVTDTDTERAVVVGADSYTAQGSYGGSRFQASAEAGYDLLTLGGTQLRPVAGVSYVRLDEDGFTETGADAYGLTVDKRVTESLKTGLGVELTQHLALGDRADGLRLSARALWRHEMLDENAGLDAAFTDYPSAAFSVDGPVVGRDSAVLGLEADAQASDTMSLYGRLDLNFNPDRLDQSISAGLRGAW